MTVGIWGNIAQSVLYGDTIMSITTLFSTIESANACKESGKTLIAKKWKQTAAQNRMERACFVDSSLFVADSVPVAFRAIVESALLESAKGILAKFCSDAPIASEIPLGLFSVESLTEQFLSRGEVWFSKEELEKEFVNSATWKRISGKAEFSSSAQYQKAANQFKDTICKLSGKTAKIEDSICDVILAKLEDSDLSTEFGGFVVRRIEAIKARKTEELDLSSL